MTCNFHVLIICGMNWAMLDITAIIARNDVHDKASTEGTPNTPMKNREKVAAIPP